MLTIKKAIKLLSEQGLPADIRIELSTSHVLDKGRYYPTEDKISLGPKSNKWTLWHEGAHAEHYRALGLAGKPLPTSESSLVGIIFITEAYVGHRLSKVPGFLLRERSDLNKVNHGSAAPGTISEWADLYTSCSQLLDNRVDMSFCGLMPNRFIMRYLPLIVAERIAGKIKFGWHLNPPYDYLSGMLRKIIMGAAEIAEDLRQCNDLAALDMFGQFAIQFYRDCGVTWKGIIL